MLSQVTKTQKTIQVSVSARGKIDFMIGIKYLRHHPKLIYQLPPGLLFYESMLKNLDEKER